LNGPPAATTIRLTVGISSGLRRAQCRPPMTHYGSRTSLCLPPTRSPRAADGRRCVAVYALSLVAVASLPRSHGCETTEIEVRVESLLPFFAGAQPLGGRGQFGTLSVARSTRATSSTCCESGTGEVPISTWHAPSRPKRRGRGAPSSVTMQVAPSQPRRSEWPRSAPPGRRRFLPPPPRSTQAFGGCCGRRRATSSRSSRER